MRTFRQWVMDEPRVPGFGNASPSVSQPVVVSATQQAESARQAQMSELRRQGIQSTLLSQQGNSTSTVGGKTILGG